MKVVNKNTLLIGSDRLDLFKSILNNLHLKCASIDFNGDLSTFFKKYIANENFFEEVQDSDVVILDFGLLSSFNDQKIFDLQKLIWYIFSLNNKLEIYISLIPTIEKDVELDQPLLNFKNCEIIYPDDNKVHDQDDEAIRYFFINTYGCIPPEIKKTRINTVNSVLSIIDTLSKKEGYTTYTEDENNTIL